jgi:hypothetical protein
MVEQDPDCTDHLEDYIGQLCATAADCCGLPCTPSTGGEFPVLTCLGECVEENGICTTTTDCCSSLTCIVPAGATEGVCQIVTDCIQYGQACTASEECCSGMACIDGICQTNLD